MIERWSAGTVEPCSTPTAPAPARPRSSRSPAGRSTSWSRSAAERTLALDPEELLVVQAHFAGEGRDPTDVELETLAQTWSEHCAHKTFRAHVTTDDGVERPSLIGSSASAPRRSTRRSCGRRSSATPASSGSATTPTAHVTIALKAETHNHPSAVEPFGGANTGVGGVIRDVLGIAHRPIAVTDVLCFGPPDIPIDDLPDGALHPLRIRDGVIDGVADYGNKIGLPTVAGAILYDPAYTTNPLVFAGCIGQATGWELHAGPFPGDRVVVLGGRTGRDGIRGATFSSLTMDATTGEVAGASVQIGDPVVEKLLIDVLVGAEHLFTAITDCGAGGLSSAVGEMAEGVGADVELDLVPLKYAGLEPWEIWLSEAQERMVVAVDPEHLAELSTRCAAHGVELADIGHFTGDGRLVVRSAGEPVLDLDTDFLHDGRPQRRMTATMPHPRRGAEHATGRTVADPAAALLRCCRTEHRLEGGDDPPLRPRDPRLDGRAPARRAASDAPGRRRGDRRAHRVGRHRDRHRRQPVVRPARPRGDGVRRRRRGDPQRRRRRRRPRPGGAARQLLVGRPAPAVDARRTGRRGRRVLRRRRTPTGRRSCRARTRSTTSTSAPTASATPCRRRW